MDSGYYFMVSHLHRHFQAVLMSTIQLEKLNIGHYVGWTFTMFYRYCGYFFKFICLPHVYVTSRTNICPPLFSTFFDKIWFSAFLPVTTITRALLNHQAAHFHLLFPVPDMLSTTLPELIVHRMTWLFYGIPFTHIHLNCLCFNIYFSSICVTSIKKIATHSSFENA